MSSCVPACLPGFPTHPPTHPPACASTRTVVLTSRARRVVGINTAIHADGEGIGFAIPINTAKRVAAALGEGKSARHSYIGIQMANTASEAARRFVVESGSGSRADLPSGVLVLGVGAGSPAEQGGLRAGDVVTRVGRRPVTTTSDLQAQVEAADVGQDIKLRVLRGGKATTVLVKVGDFRR